MNGLKANIDALAIGRPVDPAWIEHFATVVNQVLPGDAELKLRKQPGIVYVDDYNLGMADTRRLSQQDEGQRQAYVDSLLGQLYSQGELHEQVATSELGLGLHRPQATTFRRMASGLKVRIAVEDVTSASDTVEATTDDYVVESERDALIDALGLYGLRTVSSKTEPSHTIYLGMIVGDCGGEFNLRPIEQELREPVPVMGIGLLDLTTT